MPRRHPAQLSIIHPRGAKIQIYTGGTKGKTTAALGQALRALGHGRRVTVVQFCKGREKRIGEFRMAEKLTEVGKFLAQSEAGRALDFKPEFEFRQFGRPQFINPNAPLPLDKKLARDALKFVRAVSRRKFPPDLLILDEVNIAVLFGLFPVGEVLKTLDEIPPSTEVILTGQKVPPELVARADLVTEMTKIKHYFDRGQMAREGVEF